MGGRCAVRFCQFKAQGLYPAYTKACPKKVDDVQSWAAAQRKQFAASANKIMSDMFV